jgi:hypothetical protein
MGNEESKKSHHKVKGSQHEKRQKEENYKSFKAFKDKYETIEKVQEALQKAGLESSNLIVGNIQCFDGIQNSVSLFVCPRGMKPC